MLRRLQAYFDLARDNIRYQGTGILLWKIVMRLLSPVVTLDHQILFEYDLTQPIEQRYSRVDITIEHASEAGLEEIAASVFPATPPAAYTGVSDAQEYEHARYERENAHSRESFLVNARRWLRSGEICFVARTGGEIAHNNWVTFDWCVNSTRPIRLGPGEIYAAEGYTKVPWRGKGIHEAVNSHFLRYAKSLGHHRAYTITDLIKGGARRGVRRVGWTQRGHHLFIRPRWSHRTFIIQLGGNVEPVLRYLSEADL